MFRKLLLPALATALLAGCATDYTYRGGSGDYYYGRPQVEYRTVGPYGYPGFGGYFGYGYGAYGPYGFYGYGSPYGYYGSPYWGPWQPRPPRPGHGHGDGHGDADGDDRPPPWRDFGRMAPREGVRRPDEAPRPRYRDTAPQREPRSFERRPQMPSTSERSSGGSPMGRVVRGARNGSGTADD